MNRPSRNRDILRIVRAAPDEADIPSNPRNRAELAVLSNGFFGYLCPCGCVKLGDMAQLKQDPLVACDSRNGCRSKIDLSKISNAYQRERSEMRAEPAAYYLELS